MKTIKQLCDFVRETAYAIHVYHGNGHLEKVYENALAHRLRKAGIEVKQQHALNVYDEDGTLVGDHKKLREVAQPELNSLCSFVFFSG